MYATTTTYRPEELNGRMYDPAFSCFLSPDNYIQSPDFSQSFNRYAYCLNNPLKYTDPSGEWMQYVIGGIIGGINGYCIGKNAGLDGWNLVWSTVGGAAVGVATCGVGTAISGACESVAVGTILGGTTGGAISGVTFGTANAYSNGKRGKELFDSAVKAFWSGAASGFVGSSIGGMVGGDIGSFLGGFSSGFVGTKINGGSWSDAIVSGASGGVLCAASFYISAGHSYLNSGIKKEGLSFNQYSKMIGIAQRSMFWGVEGHAIPNTNGGFNVFETGKEHSTNGVCINDYKDAILDFHTHPHLGNDGFSNATRTSGDNDMTVKQWLWKGYKNGDIGIVDMSLMTREGHWHISPMQSGDFILNYDFSNLILSQNAAWHVRLVLP